MVYGIIPHIFRITRPSIQKNDSNDLALGGQAEEKP
jgi:hypothetical protein